MMEMMNVQLMLQVALLSEASLYTPLWAKGGG